MIPKNKGLLFIYCLGDLPMVAFQIKQEKAQGLQVFGSLVYLKLCGTKGKRKNMF